jgi:hypothetical protein
MRKPIKQPSADVLSGFENDDWSDHPIALPSFKKLYRYENKRQNDRGRNGK